MSKAARRLDGGNDPAPGPDLVEARRDRLLSAEQVAKILNCSPRHARYLIAQGHFRALRVGKRMVRIWESSIFDYLERQVDLYEIENGLQDGSL